MQDYKLKPCPFCGGRKIELVEPEYFFQQLVLRMHCV